MTSPDERPPSHGFDGALEDAPTAPLAIFRALNHHEVEYMVIGGVAVQAYGHVRTTQDVDILVAPDDRNLERLAAALGRLRARLKGVDAHLLDVDLTDPAQLREGANFGLATRAGGLDVWTDAAELKGARSWEEMSSRAVSAEVAGERIPFVDRDDLIRMKHAAGREKDLEDIAALTRYDDRDSRAPDAPA